MKLQSLLVPSFCLSVVGLAAAFVAMGSHFHNPLWNLSLLCLLGCVVLAVVGVMYLGKRGLWLMIPIIIALPWPVEVLWLVGNCFYADNCL